MIRCKLKNKIHFKDKLKIRHQKNCTTIDKCLDTLFFTS